MSSYWLLLLLRARAGGVHLLPLQIGHIPNPSMSGLVRAADAVSRHFVFVFFLPSLLKSPKGELT